MFLQMFDFAPSIGISISGSQSIKNASPCADSDPLSRSACELQTEDGSCGSGVIVAIRSTPLVVAGTPIYGLILTAGHVTQGIFNSLPLNPAGTKINVSFDFLSFIPRASAYVIKEYSDWTGMPLFDEKTQQKFVMPDDLCLLSLADPPPADRHAALIEQSFNIGDTAIVVGYPKKPHLITYCAPALRSEPDIVIKAKIGQAFCDFNKRVKTDGAIMNLNRELLAVNYTAASGMSGGPIFDKNGRLIGVNVGGAALPCQYELGQIISLAKNGDWAQARSNFATIKQTIRTSGKFDVSKDLEDNFEGITWSLERRRYNEIKVYAFELMQLLGVNYSHPEFLDHNLAIASTGRLFEEVCRAVSNFSNSANVDFISFEEFYRFLKS